MQLSQLKVHLSTRHALQPVNLSFDRSPEGLASMSHLIGIATMSGSAVTVEGLDQVQAVVACGAKGLSEFTELELSATVAGLKEIDNETLELLARGVTEVSPAPQPA
jgi:hypothetical protein